MTGSLSGKVVKGDGSPGTDVKVQLCTKLQCKPQTPDGEGNFLYTGLEGADFALEVLPQTEGDATTLTIITLEREEERVLETPIVVPEFVTDMTIGSAQTVSMEGGLSIEADPAGYNPPFGSDPGGTVVQGVHMDLETAGLPFGVHEGNVLGLWYLGYWNTSLDPAWSISVADLPGVEAGDVLKIVTADYLGVQWVDGGTMTVGADGVATTDEGSGIHFLSTLLIIKE
jgi:hypothetical protein